MRCVHCGAEIPDNSSVCKVCGQPLAKTGASQAARLGAAVQAPAGAPPEPAPRGEAFQAAGPDGAAPAPAQPAAAPGKPQGDGLFWKITALLVSVGLIVGGYSGELVLRGTNSSTALIVVGFVLLAWNLLSLGAHFWKQDKEEAAAPEGAGFAPEAAGGLAVRGRGLLIAAAALMLANLLLSLPGFRASVAHLFDVLGLLTFAGQLLFIVLALTAYRRRPWVLAIPAGLELLRCSVLAFSAPSAHTLINAGVWAALVVFTALAGSGLFASNRPLLIVVAAGYVFMAAAFLFDARQLGFGVQIIVHVLVMITLYWGAYFAAGAALKPRGSAQHQRPPWEAQPAPAAWPGPQPTGPAPQAAAAPLSGLAKKEYPLFTQGGVCDVCGQPLAGKKACAVPTPAYYASQRFHDYMVSGPGSAMAKMMGMDPEAVFQDMRRRDVSPASAVCEDCIHMFE
jgi:hypothetical protein